MALSTQGYPKWLYHYEHGARVFQNALEEHEAGSGWVDSPAKVVPPEEPPNEPGPETTPGPDTIEAEPTLWAKPEPKAKLTTKR